MKRNSQWKRKRKRGREKEGRERNWRWLECQKAAGSWSLTGRRSLLPVPENQSHVQSVADSRPRRWCALSFLRLHTPVSRGVFRFPSRGPGRSSTGMTAIRSTWLVEYYIYSLRIFSFEEKDYICTYNIYIYMGGLYMLRVYTVVN